MSFLANWIAYSDRRKPSVHSTCPEGKCCHTTDFDIAERPDPGWCGWCGGRLPPAASATTAQPLPGTAPVPIPQSRRSGMPLALRWKWVATRLLVPGCLALMLRGDALALTFEQSAAFIIDHIEGTTLVADDCGHGSSKFGINKQAHPDIDIENLTKRSAYPILRVYWVGIDADHLGILALAAFDFAMNAGVPQARKALAKAHGDLSKLLLYREEFHAFLVRTRPAVFARYARGFQRRDRIIALASLAPPV